MLEIKNLRFAYAQHLVLDDLNLKVNRGEVHGILGMNGAGKTTLFRTIYQFLKPQAGQLLLDNKILTNKEISFLETEPFFYSYMKGSEYLQLIAQQNPNFDITNWNRIFELPLDNFVDEYSTGMKKKLAFMGTLALDRSVIILDEPFNGVDIESNEKLLQIILRLKQNNKIVLISSHILHALIHVSDRISVLQNKHIIRTYDKVQFSVLEKELSELVKGKIADTLDDLF